MNPAKRLNAPSQHSTPLVNLFAYIRDLFTTTRPSLRFDSEAKNPYWPLAGLKALSEEPALRGSDLISCQWDDPRQPLLYLERGENQALPEIPPDLHGWIRFEDGPGMQTRLVKVSRKSCAFADSKKRLTSFSRFRSKVEGKPLEAVHDLEVPPELDSWVKISLKEGNIVLQQIEEAEEGFADDSLRKELFQAFERSFAGQQQLAAGGQELNATYDRLHDLYYSLKAQPDRQLCLSFGLISGQIGGDHYHNFLFHIPLKLKLKKQALSLEADTLAQVISCEESFTELLDNHFAGEPEEQIRERKLQVLREVDRFNAEKREFNFEPGYLRGTYYETAIRILEIFPEFEDEFYDGKKLNYALPSPDEQKGISLRFSPVIHLRPLASGVHIAHDADKIIAKINELGSQGENGNIPDYFKKLFSLRKPGNPLRIAYRVENEAVNTAPSISEPMPERFLFPLPYNEEQLSIARQLLRQDAVTVQGPPGTGKSHTIANLASHFVAQGKSILIVSKNAKALEVIKEKLPPDIRSLAVALLEGTRNQEELKHAIDAIKNNLSRIFDPAEVERMETALEQLEARSRALKQQVQEQIGTHERELALYDPDADQVVTATAGGWASRWEQLSQADELLKDTLSYQTDTKGWAEALADLSLSIRNTDLSLAGQELPDWQHYPDLHRAGELLEEWTGLKEMIAVEAYRAIPIHHLDPAFLRRQKEIAEVWESLLPYQTLLRNPRFDAGEMKALWEEGLELCEGIEESRQELMKVQLELGELEKEDPKELLEEIASLRGKFNEQGKLFFLKRKMLSSRQKALLACLLNGRELKGPGDLSWMQKAIALTLRMQQLSILMDNYLGSLGLPPGTEDASLVYREWEKVLQRLDALEVFNEQCAARQIPGLDIYSSQGKRQLEFLAGLGPYRRLLELEEQWAAQIRPLEGQAHLHPLGGEVVAAWHARELEAVASGIREMEALRKEIEQAEAVAEEVNKWKQKLPETLAAMLAAEGRDFGEKALEKAIFQRKLESFLGEVLASLGDSNLLLEELKQIRIQTESIISRLVAEKTWQHKHAAVTDEQRASLSAWRNDIINIGKGHGKNTARNMASAVANMQLAREVVPIWIMQQHTAISFFPDPEPGQFDLLIVDEASQCDISMLNLIFRCKKCLIVGDENQTSVATQARLFPIARTNQLLDRYLIHHPFRQQFNINNRSASIYTLSGVIYPNIIGLREHFRCRPELIGYSNKHVYDGHIIPLRTATMDHLGPVTEVHYIKDDPDNPKKPLMVKAALSLIEGLIEDVQQGHLPSLPTLGILCLESSNEAHRDLLIRELRRNPLIKAHADELKLLVGTSREFQGDERDIMLLTTTASHKYSEDGKIRPPRAVLGEEMMRIYNVAASRARDKAILLHSIHPEALPRIKPDCHRKRLIDHFEANANSSPAAAPLNLVRHMDPQTGSCGWEVLEFLREKGLGESLRPQFQVGPYRIDLAVMREGRKLALFIDGASKRSEKEINESIRQQLVLERAGWQCLRIPALKWQFQREEMEELLFEFC